VSYRRFLQLFVLAALLVAPFGRIGLAQAMHQQPTAMTSHCAGQPAPTQDRHEKMALDCTIACAAIAVAAAPFDLPPPAPAAIASAAPACPLSGIRPEADPPPPRRA